MPVASAVNWKFDTHILTNAVAPNQERIRPVGISEFHEELGPQIGKLKLDLLADLADVIPTVVYSLPKCQRYISHKGGDHHGIILPWFMNNMTFRCITSDVI